MKFISCLKWIKQGAAKRVPEKVTLSKEELKAVLDDAKSDKTKDDESADDKENSDGKLNKSGKEVQDEYNWDDYDEDESESAAAGLAGLSVYSSNDDDPYMAAKDEEDESDIEDFHLRPDDNLIVAGEVEGKTGVLKFYVYNKQDGDLYVHHDILLPSMPLCVEWIQDESKGENLVAVGSMTPVIEVWDVDITEVLEPNFRLGSKKNKSVKNGHTDAVLGLAWNQNYKKVLASASADHQVVLWDINSGELVTSMSNFSDKVQCLAWHPYESQHLLAGACNGETRLLDCRNPKEVAMKWESDGEIEHVIWNHFSPFYCLVSTEKGFVHCFDVRTNKSLWSLSAHTKECTGLTLSCCCPGFLATASMDEEIKIWDISTDEPNFVYKHKAKLGKIFSLECSSDHPFVICGGGDRKGNNLKVIDVIDYAAVHNRFDGRQLVYPHSSESRSETKNGNGDDNGHDSIENPGQSTSETHTPERKKRKLE